MATVFASPTASGKLSRDDAALYLERIHLPLSLLDAKPSVDLLRQLQSSHMVAVPFDSTWVHVPSWHDLDAPIELRGGETVQLGEQAFNRIVQLRRGGYCFVNNGTFASFMRYWDFRVSECCAKVNANHRKDPDVDGVDWEPISHQVSIVDWEGSNGRYLVDVGFGSSSAYPMPLREGVEVPSIPSADVFNLTKHELGLPYTLSSLLPDQFPHWVVARRCLPVEPTAEKPFYWSPLYAFVVESVSYRDFVVLNHYNSTHPDATFSKMFVATLLHPNGERTTLQYRDGMVDGQGRKAAKLARTAAPDEGKREEEMDVRWIEMRVGPIREVLEEVFAMRFPNAYAGN
ncbi:hypothetical protein JCM5296_006202 [Sporobolomyces johnsonii]